MEDGSSRSIKYRIRSFFKRLKNGNPADRFEEEIQDLIDHGAEKGVITQGEGEMIHSIFELGDTVAREIMVPRTSIVAAPVDASLGKLLELGIENGHSRLPIYEDNIDRIIGVLHMKDLLPFWGRPPEDPLPRDIIRPPTFIPESKKVAELLSEARAEKYHMAVVLDEYGGTAGLVTLEDIIEEIVGDIHDEYDNEEEPIIRLDQDTILVDARLNIEDLEEYIGLEFPDGDYDTIGGFLSGLTGRVPQENETVEWGNLVIVIRSADERKINQIEIKIPVSGNEIDTGTVRN